MRTRGKMRPLRTILALVSLHSVWSWNVFSPPAVFCFCCSREPIDRWCSRALEPLQSTDAAFFIVLQTVLPSLAHRLGMRWNESAQASLPTANEHGLAAALCARSNTCRRDDSMSRCKRASNSRIVSLFISPYRSLRMETTRHSPLRCLFRLHFLSRNSTGNASFLSSSYISTFGIIRLQNDFQSASRLFFTQAGAGAAFRCCSLQARLSVVR